MKHDFEKIANDYAESVCNGQFPIEYTRQQVVKHIKNDFMEGVKHILTQLPNGIDLMELKRLLSFSDRYEISIQFWPKQIAVYIAKDGVDLIDFGGDFDFAVGKAIEYLVRVVSHNDRNIVEVSDWHCEICGIQIGEHENGCPNNIDPRQNLLTDGFD